MKRSSHIQQHIESKKLTESVALESPRQPNNEAVPAKKRVEDSFNQDFTKLWFGAGLLLSTIFRELRVFMETHFGRKIPCLKTLVNVYADLGDDDHLQKWLTLRLGRFLW